MKSIRFIHPEPAGGASSVWPVFLPFRGCGQRCIYCAQDLQTGHAETDLQTIHRDLRRSLEQSLAGRKTPPELGFYGGTFTRLPHAWQRSFLHLAREYKQRGLLARIRCSTRPDAVRPEQIRQLKGLGLDMVELGVQSLSHSVLQASRRGYSPEEVWRAGRIVRDNGLGLGLQMMPGLPGQTTSSWLEEIRQVCRIRPDCARIYPCLVLRDTPLARIWAEGGYRPWGLQETIHAVSRATLRLWRWGIPVIRIGLPPERSLLPHILDGPWHPALGSLVRSSILFSVLRYYALRCGAGSVHGLECPKRYQGELWGHGKANRRRLSRLGITPRVTRFTDENHFTLYAAS